MRCDPSIPRHFFRSTIFYPPPVSPFFNWLLFPPESCPGREEPKSPKGVFADLESPPPNVSVIFSVRSSARRQTPGQFGIDPNGPRGDGVSSMGPRGRAGSPTPATTRSGTSSPRGPLQCVVFLPKDAQMTLSPGSQPLNCVV